jgi:hypothetical protein
VLGIDAELAGGAAGKDDALNEELDSSKAWKFPLETLVAGWNEVWAGGGAGNEVKAEGGGVGNEVVEGWTAENAGSPKRSSLWKSFPWTVGLDSGAGTALKDVSKPESPNRSSIPLVVFTGGKDGAGTDTGAGADAEAPNASSSRGTAPVPRGSKSSKSSAPAVGILAKYEPPTEAAGFFSPP